jgi:polysaccharide biosynthesis transport protein
MPVPQNPQSPHGSAKSKEPKSIGDLELRSARDYFMIIRERWMLGASCALLTVCLVGYVLLNRPKEYQAVGSLLVERQNERVVDMQHVVDTGIDGVGQLWTAILQNHVQKLRSRALRDAVIESFSEAERRQLVEPYLDSEVELDSAEIREILEGILERNLTVENLRNSFVLQLKVRHRNPQQAALLADRFATRFIRFMIDRSHMGSSAALLFLTDQADELRSKLEQSEQELHDYRQKFNVISLEENQNIVVQRLKDISSSLTEVRVGRLSLETLADQIEDTRRNQDDLLEISFIAGYGSIPKVRQELDQLRSLREVLAERYRERHPRMVENERAIAATAKLVRDNIQMAASDLSRQLEKAAQHEDSLRTELAEVEQESLRLEELNIRMNVLRRTVRAHQATYDQINQRLNQTLVTSQLENTNIRIIDRPKADESPVEPNLKKVAALLLFLGGFALIGVPLGLESIDNKLKTAWDVERFLKQKLVGEVPSLSKLDEKDRAHLVEKDLNDHAVESFRGLHGQLQLASKAEYPRTLLVASTVPREGKSFVASNLGFCSAAHGKRTLMVDFDLRRPTLHRLYGKNNDRGMLIWLKEGGVVDRSAVASESLGIIEVAPNLFLLRSGGHTKKATETIADPRVHALLETLKESFDLVILDTPPIGVFPDGMALAALSDETLYVVRSGTVNRQQVKNSIERLRETDAELLGVVINDALPRSGAGYYSNGYAFNQYAKYYAERP